jgi:hypothetical protein
MTEAKKARARSVLNRCAVWLFSLTRQIAVLGNALLADCWKNQTMQAIPKW